VKALHIPSTVSNEHDSSHSHLLCDTFNIRPNQGHCEGYSSMWRSKEIVSNQFPHLTCVRIHDCRSNNTRDHAPTYKECSYISILASEMTCKNYRREGKETRWEISNGGFDTAEAETGQDEIGEARCPAIGYLDYIC